MPTRLHHSRNPPFERCRYRLNARSAWLIGYGLVAVMIYTRPLHSLQCLFPEAHLDVLLHSRSDSARLCCNQEPLQVHHTPFCCNRINMPPKEPAAHTSNGNAERMHAGRLCVCTLWHGQRSMLARGGGRACSDASLAVYSVRPARTASRSSSSIFTASTAHTSVVESACTNANPAATKYFSITWPRWSTVGGREQRGAGTQDQSGNGSNSFSRSCSAPKPRRLAQSTKVRADSGPKTGWGQRVSVRVRARTGCPG